MQRVALAPPGGVGRIEPFAPPETIETALRMEEAPIADAGLRKEADHA